MASASNRIAAPDERVSSRQIHCAGLDRCGNIHRYNAFEGIFFRRVASMNDGFVELSALGVAMLLILILFV
jgi:hypothetical protein